MRIFSFSLSITVSNPKLLGFFFSTRKRPNIRGEMGKIKLQKIAGKPSKIVLEWNGHLEIFSRPQAIENSRQYLLLRKDNPFYRKQSLGAPDEGISE